MHGKIPADNTEKPQGGYTAWVKIQKFKIEIWCRNSGTLEQGGKYE